MCYTSENNFDFQEHVLTAIQWFVMKFAIVS